MDAVAHMSLLDHATQHHVMLFFLSQRARSSSRVSTSSLRVMRWQLSMGVLLPLLLTQSVFVAGVDWGQRADLSFEMVGFAVNTIGAVFASVHHVVLEPFGPTPFGDFDSPEFHVLAASLAKGCPKSIFSAHSLQLEPLVRLGGCLSSQLLPRPRNVSEVVHGDFTQVLFLPNSSGTMAIPVLESAANTVFFGQRVLPEAGNKWTVRERYTFPALFDVCVMEHGWKGTVRVYFGDPELKEKVYTIKVHPDSEEDYKLMVHELCEASGVVPPENCRVYPPEGLPEEWWDMINIHFQSSRFYREAQLSNRSLCTHRMATRFDAALAANGDIQVSFPMPRRQD